jgi:DNA-binding response OmpR family regulator
MTLAPTGATPPAPRLSSLVRQLVVVGGGPLPAGVLEVAGPSLLLGTHQLDVLDRLPAPVAVLVAPGPVAAAPEVVAAVRVRTCAPVVAVLDGADERQRIAVLEAGADDVTDRAVGVGELLARIAAIGRRPGLGCVRVVGGVTVDPFAREARVGGRPLTLTRREFDLLALLVGTPRRVFTHEELLRQVWGATEAEADHATVTEHVRRVRAKVRAAGGADACIASVRGVGYRFDPARCAAHPSPS